jgi:hypothetical protein
MSAYIYVKKRGEPITREDLAAATEQAPHYAVRDEEGGVLVEVPCGNLGSAWLDYVEQTGVLAVQLHAGQFGHEEAILRALRRFAGCIPGAVVEAEGEVFEPLPWDQP